MNQLRVSTPSLKNEGINRVLTKEEKSNNILLILELLSIPHLTSSPSSSMDKQMVHFSSTSVSSSSSPIFSCSGFLCWQARMCQDKKKVSKITNTKHNLVECLYCSRYLLVFVWKGESLYSRLDSSSADAPQSVLELQQLLNKVVRWLNGNGIGLNYTEYNKG